VRRSSPGGWSIAGEAVDWRLAVGDEDQFVAGFALAGSRAGEPGGNALIGIFEDAAPPHLLGADIGLAAPQQDLIERLMDFLAHSFISSARKGDDQAVGEGIEPRAPRIVDHLHHLILALRAEI